jgi:hypothetical protein
MMSIEKRIRLLEQNAADLPWPDTEIHIFVGDGSRTPDPEPEHLGLIVKAGTPQKRGKVYHREPGETEQAFIERVNQ